jgi:C4-dicarboxylate-specific signal transduction histidine kinase
MNLDTLLNVVAGALQFVVAAYALRLNRVPISHAEESSAITLEVIYSLISLLLLAGLAHIEALFKERLRFEQTELRLRAGLEAEVQKKTAYLTRAIEALQDEIDARKLMATELEAHIDLLKICRRTEPAEMHGEPEMLHLMRF